MALASTPNFSVTPSQTKTVLQSNYISLFDYSHQYAPEVHAKLANIYGNQSVSGMLHMMGAEEGFASDQVIYTEEGRLHTVYKDVSRSAAVFTKAGHVFRVNETVVIADSTKQVKGLIVDADANTFTVAPYKADALTGLATSGLTAFVYGSEFKKGTAGMKGSLDKELTIRNVSPIILKDKFEVNGSDATQISWVQTDQGYLWYLASERETRMRWEDRLELAFLLGEQAEAGSDADSEGYRGTEGLFSAIESRGNLFDGVASTIADWDSIVKRFDKQGKINNYMGYFDRDQSLAVDDMLGQLNAGYDGGISFGIFQNDKDKAVNLGFKGFTRGTYNFFKTDWKVLNDPTLLGAIPEAAGKIRGMLIPVGQTEVYDGQYNGGGQGSKITVPFLTQMYRVAGNENRKYKTWVTGTVGNVKTNDVDTMEVHHLSERLIRNVGMNNFMLMKGA